MRRHEKEIQITEKIEQVISRAQVCRLGLCRDNQPYVVPVAFGYDGAALYFHTAQAGMKIDYLNANPQVCFELEDEVNVIPHPSEACQWSFSFYSVIGFGKVVEITDAEQKNAAMNHIMRHYSEKDWDFSPNMFNKTRVWRVIIAQMTGKQSKDKMCAK
jgi:nitroimidazol reductase NimA-like FMN-containing flavoprotein (pyridoxamine 5'-phosphate oxidase superfamily)